MVGLAAAYAAGKTLHSREAGLLSMLLWILTSQLFFYERMALWTRPWRHGGAVVVAAVRMIRSGSAQRYCGVARRGGAGQTTGIAFAPLAAGSILIRSGAPGESRRAVLVCYVTFAVLWRTGTVHPGGPNPCNRPEQLDQPGHPVIGDRLA
jgi:hypothetical protein